MTERELLSIIQSDLIETPDGGLTASSPLWTPAEYLAVLNEQQRRFLSATGLVVSQATIGTLVGQQVYVLPEDCAEVLRVAWTSAAGVITDLSPLDTFEADYGLGTWGVDRETPQFYTLLLQPAQQIRILRAPVDTGSLHVLYVSVGETVLGENVELSTPEDWIDYLHWGMHTQLLGKTGPAYDPGRAGYAASRVYEGIMLSRLLLDHLASGVGPEAVDDGGQA